MCLTLVAGGACTTDGGGSCPGCPSVETRYAFFNDSLRFYAALALRVHSENGESNDYAMTALLPPGANERGDFLELLGAGCPSSLDIRIFLYRRVNEHIPIGLDETEAVELTPIVAGEVLGVPACDVTQLDIYSFNSLDAPEGTARLEFPNSGRLEAEIRRRGPFGDDVYGDDLVTWEVHGVDPDLAALGPPPLAPEHPIAGRVVLADGTGLEGIGVWLQTGFRRREPDLDPNNDPDEGYGNPIAVTKTDATGAFAFYRPAGGYRVRVFADDYLFRPRLVDIESPLENITIVAEPQ